MFNKFIEEHIIEIEEQRFITKIDFNQHISKIIKIQNFLKMKYYRGIYKSTKKPKLCRKYDPQSHILVSVLYYPDKKIIKIYVECTNLLLKHSYR
jgi:hypothetical protein